MEDKKITVVNYYDEFNKKRSLNAVEVKFDYEAGRVTVTIVKKKGEKFFNDDGEQVQNVVYEDIDIPMEKVSLINPKEKPKNQRHRDSVIF